MASSTCSILSAEIPADACLTRGMWPKPWRMFRFVSTRISSSPTKCSSRAKEEVILLPAKTRYEQDDGGTETTTERRILFSPEIPR